MSLQYPVIMSKNYVNGDDTFTISTGGTAQANLYDWDRDTTWQSIGSDDTTNETIEVEFSEGSDAINRTIDRLIMLDTNIKDFELEYWDGAAWQTAVGTDIDNNADGNVYISFTQVTTSKIRLNMLKTFVVDAEKFMSQFIVGLFTVQLSNILTTRDRNDISSEASFRLGSNGAMKHSTDYTKYSQDIPIEISVIATLNSLHSVKKSEIAFIFIWAYDDMTEAQGGIHYVNWIGGWNPLQIYKGDSIVHRVTLRLREV